LPEYSGVYERFVLACIGLVVELVGSGEERIPQKHKFNYILVWEN
jgi:hypothetical protein